jgi:hypothetical protein
MISRQLILHNFWLKLTSLVVAALLWLVIDSTLEDGGGAARHLDDVTTYREFPRRPVLVMTGMSDRRGYGAEPSEVSVTVRGPADVVERLQDSEIRVFVRVENPDQLKGGMTMISPVGVTAPPGTTVVNIRPDMVLVRPLEGS